MVVRGSGGVMVSDPDYDFPGGRDDNASTLATRLFGFSVASHAAVCGGVWASRVSLTFILYLGFSGLLDFNNIYDGKKNLYICKCMSIIQLVFF